MGHGINQQPRNTSGDRSAIQVGAFQEEDKQQVMHGRGQGGKALFAGQHKIKLNSSAVAHQ